MRESTTTTILFYTAINFTITTNVVTANPINAISTTNSYRISSTIPTTTLLLLLLYFQLLYLCPCVRVFLLFANMGALKYKEEPLPLIVTAGEHGQM